MKTVALFLITVYQVFFSTIIRQLLGIQDACRYNPTCSVYTKNMISEYGVLRGSLKGIRRILSCNPFTNYGTI